MSAAVMMDFSNSTQYGAAIPIGNRGDVGNSNDGHAAGDRRQARFQLGSASHSTGRSILHQRTSGRRNELTND